MQCDTSTFHVSLLRGIKNILVYAIGHKKMMARPLAGISHIFVMFAFLTINALLLEVIVEGMSGVERPLSLFMGKWYGLLTIPGDFFVYGGLIGIIAFSIRRYIIKPIQFRGKELGRWQHADALIDLIAILVLLICVGVMNAADARLAERGAAPLSSWFFPFSRALIGGLLPADIPTLMNIRHIAWWGHILMVFFFLFYLPFSKHYHIFLAFVYLFFYSKKPYGKVPLKDKTIEKVKALIEGKDITDDTPFGARDVKDLEWIDIIGSYACTECGRCTSSCPASLTGKKLSPRKIMMDVRHRCEEVMSGKDGKVLLGGHISHEELFACTTCMACLEACPINLRPLDIILKLRTTLIMEDSQMPQSWVSMISAMQENGAPWQLPASERTSWIKEQ